MSKYHKLTHIGSLGPKKLEEAFEKHPELFAIGAEYDPGMKPVELRIATAKWGILLNKYKGKAFQ